VRAARCGDERVEFGLIEPADVGAVLSGWEVDVSHRVPFDQSASFPMRVDRAEDADIVAN
jgi:hypothetical protein